MQIEKLSGLIEQKLHLERMLEMHSGDRETFLLRKASKESMLGSDTFSFNLIKAQIGMYDAILQNLDRVEDLHRKHLEEICNLIGQTQKVLVGRAWYTQALSISPETRKEWATMASNEQDELLARLSVNLNWRLPCLVINAYNSEVLQMASASWQLYVADVDDTLLEQAKNNISPGARNTIRTYNIKNFHDMDLSVLPQAQFGCVVIWQVMERLTLPYIKTTLDEIRKLLRPGGVVLFNVNDCDTVVGSQLATNPVSKSYVTKDLLEPMVQQAGFELRHWIPFNSHSTLVELALPGELKSIKERPGRGLVQRYNA
mgnify:CR=1 FL=1